jgi:hypothetical protein
LAAPFRQFRRLQARRGSRAPLSAPSPTGWHRIG